MGKNAHTDLPWADMPILLALLRQKSLAGAARDLAVDRTTVARRLERIETQLGTQLFERSSGTLVPTDQGRHILAVAERAEQELSNLQPAGNEKRFKYGKVRISLSEHVLTAFAPQLKLFIEEQPDIFAEFTTTNTFADLSKYEADIVLRIGRAPPDMLYTKDLGEVRFGLYRLASETGPLRVFWPRAGEADLPVVIRQNHPEAQALAAIDGVLQTREMILTAGGAGILPKFLADRDDRLAACEHYAPAGKYRLFIGCLHEQRNLNKIRIPMRYLTKHLSEALDQSFS